MASTAAIAVVSGTDSASAMPPTAERAISMATLSLVSTSPSDRLATLNKQQQRQRAARVGQHQRVDGAGDVVAAHPHRAEEDRAPRTAVADLGQLEHRRRLGDGDVVEHAERADDEAGQQQPGDRHIAQVRGDLVVLVLGQAGEVSQFDCRPG